MGTTEESIVYQLLNSIRAAELNNDEVITERRVRSLLRTHRSSVIYKSTAKGLLASDEYFQSVDVSLKRINEVEWEGSMPDAIQLPNNFGTKLMTPGFINVPIIGEENYHLSKRSIVNKFLPMAKIEEGKLMIRIPVKASPYSMNDGKEAISLHDCITRNMQLINLKVILDNPDDSSLYDWTKSPYPVPNEFIQVIKESVLKKEFNLILQTKTDQVPNMKNDTLRYHDQGKVQQ